MTEEEEKLEMSKGTPLFSLEVDDILVQKIFQRFAEEIKHHRTEIDLIKKELASIPKDSDVQLLRDSIKVLQENQEKSKLTLDQTVIDFHKSLEDNKTLVQNLIQNKLNEMLFSVNAAIRGHFETMDFDPTVCKKAMNNINNINVSINKLSSKVSDLKNSLMQMASAIDGQIGADNLNCSTASGVVRVALSRDRARIDSIDSNIKNISRKLNELSEAVNVALPYKDTQLPQFLNNYQFNRSDTPTFPPAPDVYSLHDLVQYLTTVVPMMQAMVRELFLYLQQVDAVCNDKIGRKEFSMFSDDTQNALKPIIEEFDDFQTHKSSYVLHDDFDELADKLFDIVNGVSNSSATNTRCIACGKKVQRTTGLIRIPRDSSRLKSISARDIDVLHTDGLSRETLTLKSGRLSPRTATGATRPKSSIVTPRG